MRCLNPAIGNRKLGLALGFGKMHRALTLMSLNQINGCPNPECVVCIALRLRRRERQGRETDKTDRERERIKRARQIKRIRRRASLFFWDVWIRGWLCANQ